MRPETATLEAVDAAIKELQATKLKPTSDRVLAITKGSKGTVLRHMKTLGFGLSREDPEATENPLPAIMLERAKPFIAELLQSAAELESGKYTAFSERYHRNMEELESALEEDGRRIETLEANNAELSERLQRSEEEKDLALLELEEFREKLGACERRAREAEMRVMELEAVNMSLQTSANAAADLEERLLKIIDQRLKPATVS